MVNQPFISIIIPVYNTASYLEKCLNSIKNQTFQDWECICIDDGSKDNSLEILEHYAAEDSRFKVYHQENQGQSVARNLGLTKITGEYFTYVDSDDMITPTCLEFWNKKIKENNLEILFEIGDFLNGNLTEVLYPDNSNSEIYIFENQKDALNYLFLQKLINGATCGKVYNTQKLKNYRFDTSMTYAEDSAYYLQILRLRMKIGVINSSNYIYRSNRPGSHSETMSVREKVDYLYNTYQHIEILQEFGFSKSARNDFYLRRYAKTMIYIMGAATECYNLLDEEYREKFRKTCLLIKKSTGYYPFNFFMYLRVEIFRGYMNKMISFLEYLFYGSLKRINKFRKQSK